ncbi:hypothetical protein [Glycomyces sp. NPDC021274]|uniref:hypothetical protein n=1 Tax=Glycomyces sp. NPDC021274 TaxID=3155120 RepID=UPI0033FF782C
MTDQDAPLAQRPARWPVYVVVSVLVLVSGCCGAYRWFIYDIEERPPMLTAEYESDKALLVAEDLAGRLISDLPVDDNGFSAFDSRSWATETCTSGWDGHLVWNGFVSVSVSYDHDINDDDLARRVEDAQIIADELESLGLEPTQEQHGQGVVSVRADRDDGLSILYTSDGGLRIATDCVVQGSEAVYTPPHVRISPADDHQDLEWPRSE